MLLDEGKYSKQLEAFLAPSKPKKKVKRESKELKVLRGMRKRILKGWIQGDEALDAANCAVYPWSQEATQWCLIGALRAEVHGEGRREGDRVLSTVSDLLNDLTPGEDFIFFNDNEDTTKRKVLGLLDRAIHQVEELI